MNEQTIFVVQIATHVDGSVASADVIADISTKHDVGDDRIEEDTSADFEAVETLDADASPDTLRAHVGRRFGYSIIQF